MTLFAEMTMTEWGTIIGFMASLVILPAVGHVLQYFREVRKEDREAREKEVLRLEKVKADEASMKARKLIIDKVTENTELTKATHSLVNGPMTAEKRKVYDLAQWKADHTGKPEDVRSAEEAKERLRQAVESDRAVESDLPKTPPATTRQFATTNPETP